MLYNPDVTYPVSSHNGHVFSGCVRVESKRLVGKAGVKGESRSVRRGRWLGIIPGRARPSAAAFTGSFLRWANGTCRLRSGVGPEVALLAVRRISGWGESVAERRELVDSGVRDPGERRA